MSFDATPNKLESAFIQRKSDNSVYEQINISGSNVIFYHSSSGEFTADKISAWAIKYDFGIISTTNTPPVGSAKKGTMTYNTSSNILYIYNGTTWKSSSFI